MTHLEEWDLEWTEGYIDRLINESVFYRVDKMIDFFKEHLSEPYISIYVRSMFS